MRPRPSFAGAAIEVSDLGRSVAFHRLWLPMLGFHRVWAGHDRVMWGSDYTRMRWADRPVGMRPRKRGVSYADSLNYLLRTDRLTFEQKKAVLGGSARKALKF